MIFYLVIIFSILLFNSIKNDFSRSTLHARLIVVLAALSIYTHGNNNDFIYQYISNNNLENLTRYFSLGYFLTDIFYSYKYHMYYVVHHLVIIYVATIVSLLGTMLAFPILEVICISSLWITIYILAPFAEEPWLAERYGNEYLRYKCEVRRFI